MSPQPGPTSEVPRIASARTGIWLTTTLLAVLIAVSACSSGPEYNSDPASYARAAPAEGFAALAKSSAGADAAMAFGNRYEQSDIGASSVVAGGWGTAGSPTEPLVVYAVVTGGSDVRDKIEEVAFAGTEDYPTKNYTIERIQEDRDGVDVRVVVVRGPSIQTVTAVATPTSDLTIVAASPTGNKEAVDSAIDALLESGRVNQVQQ